MKIKLVNGNPINKWKKNPKEIEYQNKLFKRKKYKEK